jgi:O-acetyl-ADP-ribose deacetylase (regulator of RNase III)
MFRVEEDLPMIRGARWNNCAIDLHQGDITTLALDAVVNAANIQLAGGGGVDGAIHRRGGPAIMAECNKIIAALGRNLHTGEAVITTGGNLPAKHVIHTAGPVYDREGKAPALLAASYRNSLAVARDRQLRTIAFPCLSTGVYGYPAEEACDIAVATVREDLEAHGGFERVVFCTYQAADFVIYQKNLAAMTDFGAAR